eukprot:gene569-315_t
MHAQSKEGKKRKKVRGGGYFGLVEVITPRGKTKQKESVDLALVLFFKGGILIPSSTTTHASHNKYIVLFFGKKRLLFAKRTCSGCIQCCGKMQNLVVESSPTHIKIRYLGAVSLSFSLSYDPHFARGQVPLPPLVPRIKCIRSISTASSWPSQRDRLASRGSPKCSRGLFFYSRALDLEATPQVTTVVCVVILCILSLKVLLLLAKAVPVVRPAGSDLERRYQNGLLNLCRVNRNAHYSPGCVIPNLPAAPAVDLLPYSPRRVSTGIQKTASSITESPTSSRISPAARHQHHQALQTRNSATQSRIPEDNVKVSNIIFRMALKGLDNETVLVKVPELVISRGY